MHVNDLLSSSKVKSEIFVEYESYPSIYFAHTWTSWVMMDKRRFVVKLAISGHSANVIVIDVCHEISYRYGVVSSVILMFKWNQYKVHIWS